MTAPSNHYVNNAELVRALEDYKARLALNPNETVPEYVGFCILEIARRFASRPNFYGYSYREEMIGDAVENCLQYITNFDSKKSTNAFSYITQICYFAFLRRIAREKKQSYIRHKLITEMPLDAFSQSETDDTEMSQNFMSYIQSNSAFDYESFEKSLQRGRKGKTPRLTLLEELMQEGEIEALPEEVQQ